MVVPAPLEHSNKCKRDESEITPRHSQQMKSSLLIVPYETHPPPQQLQDNKEGNLSKHL
jgi:hypothetical protein